MMTEVLQWVTDAGEQVKVKLQGVVKVEEKKNRHDLVTNVDKETEQFLVDKIKHHYPEDQIIGEEGTGADVTSTKGRLWVIDPIDGTLNFVKQRENFCIMIGIFEEGKPVLGFIYDVMRNECVYGGASTGVYLNDKRLSPVENLSLRDGLMGTNGSMFAKNILHTQDIGLSAVGTRMLGCAGLDFINVIKGSQNGYISNLAPWDFAAGVALAEPLGLVCRQYPNKDYDILGERQYFIVATKKTFEDIQTFF